MARARIVALVGANGTGKPELAADLHRSLVDAGRKAARVDDMLGAFVEEHARLPQRDELAALAEMQRRGIEAAAADHDLVIAQATALDVAAFAYAVHADRGLMTAALRDHARYDPTLLATLEAAPVDSRTPLRGLPRPESVEGLLRTALAGAAIGYGVLRGPAPDRLLAARAALAACERAAAGSAGPRWRHVCAECADPDCERHLFARGPAR